MKKLTLAVKISCVIVLAIMTSCSCVKDEVQNDLKSNPKLRQRRIKANVRYVQDRYVHITVEEGLSSAAMCALFNGKSLGEIRRSIDPSVDVLIEMEEVIKKRPEVKGVLWEAFYCNGTGRSTGEPSSEDFCYKPIYSIYLVGIFLVLVVMLVSIGGLAFFLIRRHRVQRS